MHRLWAKADSLTGEVISAAVEVQKHFGIGLLESIYQKCLRQELRVRGHDVKGEVAVPIRYKGLEFEEHLRVDLLVDDCLVVECKALGDDKIDMERHKAQTLSYLKLLDLPLGLVVNFGDYRLGKRGIGRVILKGAREGACGCCDFAKGDGNASLAKGDGNASLAKGDGNASFAKGDCGEVSAANVVATSPFAKEPRAAKPPAFKTIGAGAS